MLISSILVLAGIVILVIGGDMLLRGAVGIAQLVKLSPAVIGLTVVAAGTSIPELAVSGVAAFSGKPDIAVSNVIGSNIFNITVILGLCALTRPVDIIGKTVKFEYPVLLLSTLLCLLFCRDEVIDRLEAVMFIGIYVAFTAFLVSTARLQVSKNEEQSFTAEVDELTVGEKTVSAKRSWIFLIVGVALLCLGAQLTVAGSSDLARLWGWTERVIGLTLVSAGTGLPEVVASLMSALRGRADIAVGNVIGSNLFNILATLGLTGLIHPIEVQEGLINSDCWWMLGVTVILLPIMHSGLKINRIEGGLLLGIYGVYLALLLAAPV